MLGLAQRNGAAGRNRHRNLQSRGRGRFYWENQTKNRQQTRPGVRCPNLEEVGRSENRGGRGEEKRRRRERIYKSTRVIVFPPRRRPSHKSRWGQQVDNKTYSSLREMAIGSLVRGSDSSSWDTAEGSEEVQACLYRGRTHLGQKCLPQIGQ